MRRLRLTTRRIMAGVLVFGLVLGLAPPALYAWRDGELHQHSFIKAEADGTYWVRNYALSPPFLARYASRLIPRGQAERGDCGYRVGLAHEYCLRADPGLSTCFGPIPTANQKLAVVRLDPSGRSLKQIREQLLMPEDGF